MTPPVTSGSRTASARSPKGMRRALCVVGSVFLALALDGRPARAGTPVPSAEEMKALHRVVAEIRGLEFKHEVPFEVLPLGSFASRVRTQVRFAEEAIAARETAFQALGLYPRGVKEAEERLRMTLAAGTAFYARAPLRTMYVVDRGAAPERNSRRMMIDMLLSLLGSRSELVLSAHELTHALQEQWFPGSLSPAGNDDEVLAMTALFEGDANLVTYEYIARLGKRSAQDLFAPHGDLPFDYGAWLGLHEVDTAPRWMRESFLMPYTSGVRFVRALRDRGGWAAVNRAYADPPRSTEQILHPEKYFLERDLPREVRLPAALASLFPEASLVREGTVGELGLRVLFHELEGQFVEFVHGGACDGWGGDCYAVFQSKDGGRPILVWASVWDSEVDAALFLGAYRVALAAKYAETDAWGSAEADVGFTAVTKDDRLVLLRREGRDVLVLEGLAPSQETLAEQIWNDLHRAVPTAK
jgi:hypothetical protein